MTTHYLVTKQLQTTLFQKNHVTTSTILGTLITKSIGHGCFYFPASPVSSICFTLGNC